MIRLHVPDDLDVGLAVAPTQDQTRYLVNVMRLAVEDEILVFNGRHGEWRAAIELISKRSCILRLIARTRAQSDPYNLDLVVALVKRPRLEAIVEKAAELGAARVRLLLTRRTNVDRVNLQRLSAIATEASEQTGRLDAPEIVAPQKLSEMIVQWKSDRRLMFCDEAGDDPEAPWGGVTGKAPPVAEALKNAAQHKVQDKAATSSSWAIMIGPEGGFAPEEREQLRRLPFVQAVSLGPRILRADTAAIAAMSIWQAILGDWRQA